MKPTCRRLIRFLEKGRYGDTFLELPDRFAKHIQSCEDCRRFLAEMEMSERRIGQISPELPDSATVARIKSRILNELSTDPVRRSWWPAAARPFPAAALLTALLVMVALFQYSRNDSGDLRQVIPQDQLFTAADYQQVQPIPVFLDDQMISLVLFGSIGISEADDYLQKSYADRSAWLYNEDTLSEFTQFGDSDWEDLRRYLS